MIENYNIDTNYELLSPVHEMFLGEHIERTRRGQLPKVDGHLVLVTNVWVGVDLDEHWRAAYRLVAQADRFVVGEVRLVPREEAFRGVGNCWSGTFLGVKATVPRGGVTTRVLRKIPAIVSEVNRAQSQLRDLLMPHFGIDFDRDALGRKTAEADASELKAAYELIKAWSPRYHVAARPVGHSRGRKGHSAKHYASIAKTYAALVDKGNSRPLRTIATRRKLTVEQVRAAVAKARRLGFLTQTVQGGRDLLRRQQLTGIVTRESCYVCMDSSCPSA